MSSDQEKERLLNRWLTEHQGIFHKIARSYTTAVTDEAELVQEMIVQLWRSLGSFREQCKPSTWIYRVCLNTALTWRRGVRRRQSVTVTVASPPLDAATDQPRPGWTQEQAELLAQLYQAMRALPAAERTLVILSLDGLSYREISDITGLSENHVGVALTRTRRKLSEMLKGVRHEL